MPHGRLSVGVSTAQHNRNRARSPGSRCWADEPVCHERFHRPSRQPLEKQRQRVRQLGRAHKLSQRCIECCGIIEALWRSTENCIPKPTEYQRHVRAADSSLRRVERRIGMRCNARGHSVVMAMRSTPGPMSVGGGSGSLPGCESSRPSNGLQGGQPSCTPMRTQRGSKATGAVVGCRRPSGSTSRSGSE